MMHQWQGRTVTVSVKSLGMSKTMYLLDASNAVDLIAHDDVIKWKHFPRYWPFVRGIPRSPVNSPHKGQWRGALMFTLICARINGWVNNCKAGDLRGNHAHYDVIVMHRVSVVTGDVEDNVFTGCVQCCRFNWLQWCLGCHGKSFSDSVMARIGHTRGQCEGVKGEVASSISNSNLVKPRASMTSKSVAKWFWISNHISYKVWDEIAYPFPSLGMDQ